MDIVRDVHHYLLTDAFDPRSPDKHYSTLSELSQSDCEAIANLRMAQKNKHNLFAAHAAAAKRYAKDDDALETLEEHYDHLMAKIDSLPNADEAKRWLETYKCIIGCVDVSCARLEQVIEYFSALDAIDSDGAKHGGQGDEVDAILKQRQEQWGDAYLEIAGDWNTVLGMEVTNAEFIAMMILMKLRRWSNSDFEADDCLTDIIGYAKLGLSLSDKA